MVPKSRFHSQSSSTNSRVQNGTIQFGAITALHTAALSGNLEAVKLLLDGGASVGGLIGSAVHHPLAGAMIGTVLGAGAGGLIGDQLQGRDNAAYDQDQQIYRNQQDLENQRRDIDQLRRRPEY